MIKLFISHIKTEYNNKLEDMSIGQYAESENDLFLRIYGGAVSLKNGDCYKTSVPYYKETPVRIFEKDEIFEIHI